MFERSRDRSWRVFDRAIFGLALIVGPPPARAEGEPNDGTERHVVELQYNASAGCPSRARFIHWIETHLGHPIDVPRAREIRFSVNILEGEDGHELALYVHDGNDLSLREIPPRGQDCAAMARAGALVVAIAIDPDVAHVRETKPDRSPKPDDDDDDDTTIPDERVDPVSTDQPRIGAKSAAATKRERSDGNEAKRSSSREAASSRRTTQSRRARRQRVRELGGESTNRNRAPLAWSVHVRSGLEIGRLPTVAPQFGLRFMLGARGFRAGLDADYAPPIPRAYDIAGGIELTVHQWSLGPRIAWLGVIAQSPSNGELRLGASAGGEVVWQLPEATGDHFDSAGPERLVGSSVHAGLALRFVPKPWIGIGLGVEGMINVKRTAVVVGDGTTVPRGHVHRPSLFGLRSYLDLAFGRP